ncbi:MAG: hypothetical protein KA174_08250, partial [Chitinophagales bacterium]|nr:hypothetical protein [Chitinophagales bacterium]
MSDAEMIDYLQQHSKQKICGHFRNEQLYQAEKIEINLASIPTNLSFRKYFAIALLIAFTSFGLVSCKTNSGRTVGKIEVVDTTNNILDSQKQNLKIDTSQANIKNTSIKCTATTGEIEAPPLVTTGISYIEPLIDTNNINNNITVEGELKLIPTIEDSVKQKTMGKPVLPKQK